MAETCELVMNAIAARSGLITKRQRFACVNKRRHLPPIGAWSTNYALNESFALCAANQNCENDYGRINSLDQ
jgi:hypothetical protein